MESDGGDLKLETVEKLEGLDVMGCGVAARAVVPRPHRVSLRALAAWPLCSRHQGTEPA